jgi:hypothetical protein
LANFFAVRRHNVVAGVQFLDAGRAGRHHHRLQGRGLALLVALVLGGRRGLRGDVARCLARGIGARAARPCDR